MTLFLIILFFTVIPCAVCLGLGFVIGRDLRE